MAQDDAEAVKWFRLAAEQGFATGQFHLGLMYENGRGVAQDDAEAVKWFPWPPSRATRRPGQSRFDVCKRPRRDAG